MQSYYKHTIHDYIAFCKSVSRKSTRRVGIDKSARLPYNNSEERTTHTVSSSSSSLYLWQSHKYLLSLGWSGGRFFIVLCLCFPGSLPDDDRHSPLPYVKGQTHTHHLLPGKKGWNQPPACLLFTLHRPLRTRLFYRILRFMSTLFVIRGCGPTDAGQERSADRVRYRSGSARG